MEVDFQCQGFFLGLCVLTIGKLAQGPMKWALGKKHLWEKDKAGHLHPCAEVWPIYQIHLDCSEYRDAPKMTTGLMHLFEELHCVKT